jgi:ribose transport system substrate-binding protein
VLLRELLLGGSRIFVITSTSCATVADMLYFNLEIFHNNREDFTAMLRKSTQVILLILLSCVVLLSGIWVFFQKNMEQIDMEETRKMRTYKKHYVLIADEKDSMLWQSVYEAAVQEAASCDAYLELIQPDDNEEYTLEDRLQISIASQVDGIILRPDGTTEVRELIDEAVESGIPVVTILSDDSASLRTSFVGLNSYQMGDAYTEQALQFLNPDTTEIMLLVDSENQDSGANLIYSQIVKQMDQEKTPQQTVNVTAYPVDSSSDFNMEEVIRDIFVNGTTLPDVMICLDEVVTECAYQALLDYNEVGNTDIIGFYYSDLILDAIKKGTIPATIALNPEEIGTYSISALEDYLSLGYASDYYSVGMTVITAENVSSFKSVEGDSQ